MFAKKILFPKRIIIFLMTCFMSVSHGYADSQSRCLQVVKERDNALQKLNLAEFEKENAQRGWNDALTFVEVLAKDLATVALEHHELLEKLQKNMPNNKQFNYRYEMIIARDTAIIGRMKAYANIFKHVEERTNAFRELNEANKLKDKPRILRTLKVIAQHHGYVDALNKEIKKLDQEIDALNNKLSEKISQ